MAPKIEVPSRHTHTKHGYTTFPQSRALWCAKNPGAGCGAITGEPQSVEAPKGWPHAAGSPADGHLASGGHRQFASLDGVLAPNGIAWPATKVKPGELCRFAWYLTAVHKTSGWEYWITRDGWDQDAPLARNQFESAPFLSVAWPCEGGGWTCRIPVKAVQHWGRMPEGKRGRHAIYGIWTVGDTAAAFYQVSDVDFG